MCRCDSSIIADLVIPIGNFFRTGAYMIETEPGAAHALNVSLANGSLRFEISGGSPSVTGHDLLMDEEVAQLFSHNVQSWLTCIITWNQIFPVINGLRVSNILPNMHSNCLFLMLN